MPSAIGVAIGPQERDDGVAIGAARSTRSREREKRERIEREDKHYKFSANDVRERRNWDAYQEAY